MRANFWLPVYKTTFKAQGSLRLPPSASHKHNKHKVSRRQRTKEVAAAIVVLAAAPLSVGRVRRLEWWSRKQQISSSLSFLSGCLQIVLPLGLNTEHTDWMWGCCQVTWTDTRAIRVCVIFQIDYFFLPSPCRQDVALGSPCVHFHVAGNTSARVCVCVKWMKQTDGATCNLLSSTSTHPAPPAGSSGWTGVNDGRSRRRGTDADTVIKPGGDRVSEQERESERETIRRWRAGGARGRKLLPSCQFLGIRREIEWCDRGRRSCNLLAAAAVVVLKRSWWSNVCQLKLLINSCSNMCTRCSV